MNKDEMLEDMKIVINQSVVRSNSGLDLSRGLMALSLDKLGYRKVGDDEMVIKKSEYKELKKYRTDWLNSEKMHLQAELEDTEFELGCSNRLFQKVCEEKKELEKQLEQVKQETAREILALIGKPNYKGDDWYEGAFFKQEQIREQIADIYGIELE